MSYILATLKGFRAEQALCLERRWGRIPIYKMGEKAV